VFVYGVTAGRGQMAKTSGARAGFVREMTRPYSASVALCSGSVGESDRPGQSEDPIPLRRSVPSPGRRWNQSGGWCHTQATVPQDASSALGPRLQADWDMISGPLSPGSPGSEREVARSKSFRGSTLPRRGDRGTAVGRSCAGGTTAPRRLSPRTRGAGPQALAGSAARIAGALLKKTALFCERAARSLRWTLYRSKVMGLLFGRVDDLSQAAYRFGA
jgi:hypothetical protein